MICIPLNFEIRQLCFSCFVSSIHSVISTSDFSNTSSATVLVITDNHKCWRDSIITFVIDVEQVNKHFMFPQFLLSNVRSVSSFIKVEFYKSYIISGLRASLFFNEILKLNKDIGSSRNLFLVFAV